MMLYFQDDECDECIDIAADFEALATQYSDQMTFRTVDTIANSELVETLEIDSVPMFATWLSDDHFSKSVEDSL